MTTGRSAGAARITLAIAALALVLGIRLLGSHSESSRAEANVVYRLAPEESQRWLKGNLHTHSHWSDGDDYPEMIALWYRDRGYDFLAYTDHNNTQSTEKWIDVEKSKGGQKAFDKLLAKFPDGWVEQRMTDGRLETRLKRFDELFAKLAIPDEFLLIRGEEISDSFQKLPIHLNATNIQETIPPMHGDSVTAVIQNNVDAVIAQRERTKEPIMVHLNHPNFGFGVTAEELMHVRGENFFEVYNGHPGVHNSGDHIHVSTERIWDIVLTQRIDQLDLPIMYGLATDDGHSYHNMPSRGSEPGRGWVMVLADKLTPESLIEALESGKFYASSGVTLKSVSATEKRYFIEVQPEEGVEYEIEFIGTRSDYDPTSRPMMDDKENEIRATRVYSNDLGKVFKTVKGPVAEYVYNEKDLYIRARVTSTKKHPNPSEVGEFERAWAQPVLGPSGRK